MKFLVPESGALCGRGGSLGGQDRPRRLETLPLWKRTECIIPSPSKDMMALRRGAGRIWPDPQEYAKWVWGQCALNDFCFKAAVFFQRRLPRALQKTIGSIVLGCTLLLV